MKTLDHSLVSDFPNRSKRDRVALDIVTEREEVAVYGVIGRVDGRLPPVPETTSTLKKHKQPGTHRNPLCRRGPHSTDEENLN